MKKKACFVSLDPKANKVKAVESSDFIYFYNLPDGQVIKANSQRFMAPEILFDPKPVEKGIQNDYKTTSYY